MSLETSDVFVTDYEVERLASHEYSWQFGVN